MPLGSVFFKLMNPLFSFTNPHSPKEALRKNKSRTTYEHVYIVTFQYQKSPPYSIFPGTNAYTSRFDIRVFPKVYEPPRTSFYDFTDAVWETCCIKNLKLCFLSLKKRRKKEKEIYVL